MFKVTKNLGIIILPLAVMVIGLFVVTNNASAAACANANNYGVATMTVNIPTSGDYRIWSRIKVPSTAASTYQLEADSNTCWQVGGSNVPVNAWTWVNWYGGNSAQKISYTFSTTGSHTLKLIGVATNVQVDKVILLGTGELCSDGGTTPTGDGTNCATAPTPTSGSNPTQPVTTTVTATTGQQVVEPKENQVISQGQLISLDTSTVTDTAKIKTVQKVEFYDDKTLVQTVTEPPFVLDSKKLATGSHSITQKTFYKDGTTSSESMVVEVKGASTVNGAESTKNSMSPLIIGFGSLLAVIVVAALVGWYFVLRPRGLSLAESAAYVARRTAGMFKRSPTPNTPSTTLAENPAPAPPSEYSEPVVISPDNKDLPK